MKGLYCCVVLASIVFYSGSSFGQSAGDYRSFQTGNWGDVATWERFDGSSWINPAPSAPTNADGAIEIRSGHTVTVAASVSADQMTVDAGGVLVVSSSQVLTIAAGPSADDLTINGQVINNGSITIFYDGPPPPIASAIVRVNGTLTNAGMINNASNSLLFFNSGSVYQHAFTTSPGTIPLAAWNANSTCLISSYTTNAIPPANLNQTFGHFTWNTPDLSEFIDLNGALTSIAGNLTFTSSPGYVYLTQSTPLTLNVSGNLTIGSEFGFSADALVTVNVSGNTEFNGGTTYFTGPGNLTLNLTGDLAFTSGTHDLGYDAGSLTINLSRNLTFIGGTLNESGTAVQTINFSGLSPQAVSGSGSSIVADLNYVIKNLAVVDLGTSSLYGPGDFTLNSGGTVRLGSTDKTSAGDGALSTNAGVGNITVTGTRTYTAGGNIMYNGAASQNIGNGFPNTAVNLEINNASGVTNNNNGTTNVIGNLLLTDGPLYIGNNNVLDIQSNMTITGGTIGSDETSSLTFSGTGSISGTLAFAPGSTKIKDLTISRSGTIPLGSDLSINGTLSFESTGNLDFSGYTLTIEGNAGNIAQSGSGGLVSNSSSNLIINGLGALTSLPFSGSGNGLNNVTFGRTTSATYTWNGAVTINGTLALNSGTLTHSSGLTMASGSTFLRNAGASITSNAPNAVGSYNVSYSGNLTTGLELPSSVSRLNDLVVAGDVVLDKAITINGDVSINSGTLDASTFDLTMAGENFLVNGGSFTMGSTKTITFSRAGTTALGGSSVSGIQFGNLSINSGATLSAPNENINISGTWTNGGAFSPNSGTVTFNGSDQSIDGNGQPFNNIAFSGTGVKTLAGVLDVNGTLTIATGIELDAGGSGNSIYIAGTWSNAGTFTHSGNTVVFDGNTAQTITEAGSFYNLELDGTGAKSLGASVDIDNNLTIQSGATFSTGTNYPITIAGNWTNDGTFTAGTTGTVTFNGTSVIGGASITRFRNLAISGSVTAPTAMEIAGNWSYTSGTFNANSGTVTFNGSGNQSITPGTQSFYNVVVGGSSTKTLLGDTDINGNLTLNGATLGVGTRTVRVAGNFDASGGGALNAGTGLFVFDGANQSITSAGKVFYNIEFSGTATKTLADALDVNGGVDINSSLAAGSNAINVAGNWDATGGSFTTSGLTTFDGVAQNITSNGSSFGALTVAGSGTKTLLDALDVNDDLTISSTLDVNTGNFAVAVGGDFTATGTFIERSGQLTLDGAAQAISTGTNDLNHLVISGSGVKTQQNALVVNGNLTVNSGAELNAGADFGLTLAGNLTTNGVYDPGSSTLLLTGGVGQSIGGTFASDFYNITVNKSSGTAIIASSQNLINVLTLTSGTLNANGMLTLVSSASGDARIAEITGGSITGGIIAQRYLPISATLPSGGVYRYFSSPVTDAYVSDLKDDFPVTGLFNDPSTQAEWPGLAVTSTARIMFLYNEAHQPTTTMEDRYETYPYAGTNSTEAPLVNGVGYSARVRQTTPVVLDFPGTPQTGDVPVSVTAQSAGGDDGWNLIGNPYPAPINWDKVTRPTGVNAQIALKDNADNSGIGAGQYVYYTQGNPGVGIPASYNGDISSGQAFWVRATSNATITFQENDKQDISNPDFMRMATPQDLLRITVNGNDRMDELVIQFKDGASDAVDENFDAFKLKNDYINFSSLSSDSLKMAINVLGSLSCNKEVGLVLEGVSQGSYSFNFSQFETFGSNISLRLLDNYAAASFDITDANSVYQFQVTEDPATFGKDRFRVYVTYPEVLTHLFAHGDPVCVGTDASITIENSQQGIKYYPTINGNAVGDAVVSAGGTVQLNVLPDKLTEGDNLVVLMASIAGCSAVPLENSVNITTDKIYEISSVTESKRCEAGEVSLTAEGAPEAGFYKWYESAESATPIEGATSAEFLTPTLEKSRAYYVSAVNSLGCEGPRKEVMANVVLFDEVSIAIDEQTLVSSYETGNQWYFEGEPISGATGRSIEVTETGLYEVEVITTQGCSTRVGQEMIVLGFEDPLAQGYHAYPNPVEQKLTIQLPTSDPATGFIQSSAGKTMGSLGFSSLNSIMSAEYDMGDQAPGLYFVRIFQGNRIVNIKVIKR